MIAEFVNINYNYARVAAIITSDPLPLQ